MDRLPRTFYTRGTLRVAQELIGKLLVHESPDGRTCGRIVETEAYLGPLDPAAHSYKRRRDGRTSIQYGDGGYAYIYLIYGMYYCLNIVTNGPGLPEVVLLRALEPIDGLELMELRRKTDKLKNLCSGPGKLCQAMGVDSSLYGADLVNGPLYLTDDPSFSAEVEASKRINIDYAGEARDYLWRFTAKGSPFLSVKEKLPPR